MLNREIQSDRKNKNIIGMDGHTQRMKVPARCRCCWIRQIPICMKINNYARSIIYVHIKELKNRVTIQNLIRRTQFCSSE